MDTRRTFLKKGFLAAGTLALPSASWMEKLLFQQGGNMQLIRNNVGFFTESGGTIGWYLSKTGIVVVDAQFPAQAGHLIEKIRETSDRTVDLLINTHHHADHTGGNIAFKDMVKKVVAHTNSRVNQENAAKARNTEAQQLYPDTTFETQWSQQVDQETVKAYYFGPAHTNGDSVIHFEQANIAHVGDLMFNRRFPYIDKTAGASISNWMEVLQQVRKTFDNDTRFIFGHAGDNFQVTGSKADLSEMENYLEKLLDYVKKAIKQGVDEKALIAKTTVIPGAEAWTGQGVERSITAAYLELKK